jgi:hypothetical protein
VYMYALKPTIIIIINVLHLLLVTIHRCSV